LNSIYSTFTVRFSDSNTVREFDIHVTVHRDKFFIIKPIRCTNFSNLFFGMKLYMFWTVPLSIIRSCSLYTQQWCMLYRFADSLRAGSGWNCSSILILLASCQHNLYDIHHCCVYSEQLLMMDRGTVQNM